MNQNYMILTFFLWALLHSLLASASVKNVAKVWFGENWLDRYYRFFYNAFASISFLPALYFLTMEVGPKIYQFSAPFTFLARAVQAALLVLMVYSVGQTGLLKFLGLRSQLNIVGTASFVSNGLYKLVRHPIYTTGLALLWLEPSMTSIKLTFNILVTLYILIGIQFEERRLLREFGDTYFEYRSKTPMLIPFLKN